MNECEPNTQFQRNPVKVSHVMVTKRENYGMEKEREAKGKKNKEEREGKEELISNQKLWCAACTSVCFCVAKTG